MHALVIDASAMGAVVFGEPKAEEIANALTDAPMVAPALLWSELASICLKKIGAHLEQADHILEAFSLATISPSRWLKWIIQRL